MDGVSDNGTGPAPLVASRHYYRADYHTHHRAAYFTSVRTYSEWTMNAECVNLEGLQSWHLADGVNPLYVDGKLLRALASCRVGGVALLCPVVSVSCVLMVTWVHGVVYSGREYDGIFPVWDWVRLPGTTEWSAGSPCNTCIGGQKGLTKLVGGTSTGMYGATAMQLHTGACVPANVPCPFGSVSRAHVGVCVTAKTACAQAICTALRTRA